MKILSRFLFAALLSFLSVVAFAQSATPKQKLPKRIVADYTNGSKYLNPPYDVAQIPFDKLTHINHAGVPWDANGVLQVPDGFVEPDLISKAHAAECTDEGETCTSNEQCCSGLECTGGPPTTCTAED